MTMTFPTEQDRLFFTSEEAKRIQELWEPREGDWVRVEGHDRTWVFVVAKHQVSWAKSARDSSIVTWLPRQGQLQEMLEERGWGWTSRTHCEHDLGKQYRAALYLRETGESGPKAEGPTPAIALGRALIEVMSKEGTAKEEDFQEFIMRETAAAIEGGIIDENTGLPFELAKPEGTGKEEEKDGK